MPHDRLARDFVQSNALDGGRGAGEILPPTNSELRPTASKICAPPIRTDRWRLPILDITLRMPLPIDLM